MANTLVKWAALFAIWMLAATPLAADPPSPELTSAVTIFEAARIITMEPSQPSARFVAVADGIILGTADSVAELSAWTRGRPVTLDRRFARNTLMPGFIDPHVHPMQAAVMMNLPFIAPEDWDLPGGMQRGAQTPEAYRARLREELARSAARPFITWGFHELFHGPLDRAELDRIAPDRPVVIWQRSFHEVIMNSAALSHYRLDTAAAVAAMIAEQRASPSDADLARGIFTETALTGALARMRGDIITPARITTGMAAMQQMMLTNGVTTIADLATGVFAPFDTEAALIRAAFERADNPSRVMLVPIAAQMPADTSPGAWLDSIQNRYASAHIRVDRRVKLFADGAFFAQNMMMNAPGYADGHIGRWLTPPDVLAAQMRQFWSAGISLHIHVNGDAGLDAVLAIVETLPPRPTQTITLEHVGIASTDQVRRIAELNVMVSAQPNYVRVLSDVYAAHGLGPDRAATINRLGSIARAGVPLGLHSDFNMAPIDPLYLAWIASNRISIAGRVQAPHERLLLDQALRAITIDAARVIGMATEIGSITPGKRADFAVLDADPYRVGASRLDGIGVRGVIYGGRFFEAERGVRR